MARRHRRRICYHINLLSTHEHISIRSKGTFVNVNEFKTEVHSSFCPLYLQPVFVLMK